jgi:hypothetical protein
MGFEDGVKALLGDVLLGGQFLEVLGRGFAADKSVGVLAEGSPIDYAVETRALDGLLFAPCLGKNVVGLDRSLKRLNIAEGFAREEIDRAVFAE